MTQAEPTLLFEIQGQVAIVTLNRPTKINAMDGELFDLLEGALRRYSDDDSLRCMVITGAGGNFSAGGDMKWFHQMHVDLDTPEHRWAYHFRAYEMMHELTKPIISAIDGYCIASAFNLAIVHTDIRIATTRAKIGLPGPQRGLGIGHYAMPWHNYTGLGNIMYLALTGAQIGPDEALRMGLVNEIVEPEDLLARATELAHIVCEGDPVEVMGLKEFWRTYLELPGGSYMTVANTIRKRLDILKGDAEEGRKAFLEGRAPSWVRKA